MSKLTYLTNHNDWEAVYIDGEQVADGHLGRIWPNDVLNIIEEHNIDETEIKSIEPETAFPLTLHDDT